MAVFHFVNFIVVFFVFTIKDSLELQNVKLILPSIVQAGTSATLLCLYDLEGASLYSVQWYRGQFEFFRFVPNENPPFKIFSIPGLLVDIFSSNEHQVTLQNISMQISGEFSCEITTDAPPFSTSCVSDNLTVIDFKLDLKIPKRVYRFGDIMEINCTLTPKLPSTKLVFHWNGQPVSESFVSEKFSNFDLLRLNTSFFDTRQPFSSTSQLRCSALLNDMYYITSKTVSLQLEPSKFSFSSVSCKLEPPFESLQFMFLILTQLVFTTDLYHKCCVYSQI